MIDDVKGLKDLLLDKQISDYRWEIINTADKISNGRIVSKECLKHAIATYDKYETIIEEYGLTKGMHFIWYDVFEKMNEKDVENFLKRCKNQHYKRVICLTTNKVFDTIKDAAREYNIKSPVGITRCCRGESEYSGKLYDGTKLKWKYYNE